MSDSLDITPNVTLYDDAGNPVNVILNNGIYRLAGNSLLVNAAGTPITSTTIGGKELLDVNASSDPTQYTIETDYDVTGVSVPSGSDTTLFTFSGAGVIDFIAVTCATSSSWSIILDVDSSEKVRIPMGDLGSTLGLTGATEDYLYAATANKQFRWIPRGNAGFTSSFSVKAQATGATVTLFYFISYRELAT